MARATSSLPVPLSPRMRRRVALEHATHLLRELAHGAASAHDGAEHGALTQGVLQTAHVERQGAALLGAAHRVQQAVAVEWLGD